MKRSLLLALLLMLAACGSGVEEGTTTIGPKPTTTTMPETATTAAPVTTTTGATPDFPVTIEADNGSVTLGARPESIISLSATATEMLFAIGAGPQVVAVDDQSNYPEEAPVTDLSGFTPNVEAILSYEPDLVVIGYDPGELVASLEAADVDVINYSAAVTINDVYRQINALGAATGHPEDATILSESIANDLAKIADQAPDAEGVTYYHEVDNTFYSLTSATFFGQIYGLFGLENIADPADEDGSAFGYPQLSSEYIVSADPDIMFLADALYGESAGTVAARPGWDVLTAVQEGNVVELDSDIASRWGPRIVDFAQLVSDAIGAYVSGG
ncbi:MAG TPA: ABC transporter substrate-binding protein [Acidimicrobiia bacterium]|nr:ABC transporter substrate-binding protein [Acidimicrobiia bacterium]